MLPLIHDLVRHKGYADCRLLTAIHEHESAARDQELRDLLHHVILANRFWLLLILGEPFALEEESRVPAALGPIVQAYRSTHQRELDWISHIADSDLERSLESPFFPGRSVSVLQALTQVCMHSHGHRAQCAKMLRAHGATPPTLDYILWLNGRPSPSWPV